jgi:catechol 2,3-dioxygenase-like lactoylglutathione lyase family enzyme
MPQASPRIAAKPMLTAVEPQLFVASIDAACDFFVQKLGFSVVSKYGNPPFYGQVKRDAAHLNLRCVDKPVFDNALRDREHLLSASMIVDDIKQLYLEYQSAGVDFHQPLRKEPWGARDFIVRDPDGNLLLFAGPGE